MKPSDFPTVEYDDWRQLVETQFGDANLTDILTTRADGVEYEALSTASHPRRHEPWPVPWTRSPSTPEKGPGWILQQEFDQADPEELNSCLKSDLAHGVSGVWLRLDAGGGGADGSVDERYQGLGGARLHSVGDWIAAFEGVPRSWQSMLLDAGGCFLPAAAVLKAWLDREGLDLTGRTLLLGADPMGALAREGRLPSPFELLIDDLAVLVRQSRAHWPQVRSLAVSARVYREAGAEIDQELAICLATAVEVLRCLDERGIEPSAAAAELAFVTSTGQQIFLEIAKLRALRGLWGRVQRSIGKEVTSPFIHAAALRRNLSPVEPTNNILRTTAASWAAILGGADSVSTPGYSVDTSQAIAGRGRRLARNTQLILGHEVGLGLVDDPGAGSYFLETVTQALAEKAWLQFQEIERRGGILATLLSGWLQSEIESRWQKRRRRLESSEIPLTGVNVFRTTESADAGDPIGEEVEEVVPPGRDAGGGERATHTTSSVPNPPPTDRWQWAFDNARANRPIDEMCTALYPEPGPAIEPFVRHSDSEPFAT